MDWKLKRKLYAMCFTVTLVNGVIIQSKFERTFGNGVTQVACASMAGRRPYLATMIDASNRCTRLDWDWGSSRSFDAGSTYYEKKHIVEIYDTPMVLGGPLKLPITFIDGAYIDMHIEFTVDDFSYGCIRLVDTVDDAYDVYSGDAETVMVNMEMVTKNNYVIFKTYYYGWVNHATITPYPFPAGSMHKITFKALTNVIQILVDDVEAARIQHYVPPQNAKMLQFSNVGMQLHEIKFVGV